MELDKDLPLFSIIHNQLELLKNNDTNEMEISFYKAEGSFTEFEFNNFTNVCRSFNCKESIDNEYLEVTGDNNILHIDLKSLRYNLLDLEEYLIHMSGLHPYIALQLELCQLVFYSFECFE